MKHLAIHGGEPTIDIALQGYAHPQIPANVFRGMSDPEMQSSIVTFEGRGLVSRMEKTFERVMNAKHALATNSGTSALYAMFYALGLRAGDQVLVPAYTFFATAMPLFRLGCEPVLVDSLDNGNIDPDDIRAKVTPTTRAIVITHMWGIPCDMDEIMRVAVEFSLPVLEDASHAHGATYRGTIMGTMGTAGAWSLGAKKLVTGGQGGMLQTGDRGLFERASLVTRANDKAHEGQITHPAHAPYAVTGCGLNLRIHPFSAAIIDGQLQQLGQQISERREVAQLLKDGLGGIPGISFPRIPEGADPAWYAFPMQYHTESMCGVSKETFVDALIAEGAIEVDLPGSTCPLTAYRTFCGDPATFNNAPVGPLHSRNDFPGAEAFHHRLIKLPVWYGDRRKDHAHAYINAIIKVAENIAELA